MSGYNNQIPLLYTVVTKLFSKKFYELLSIVIVVIKFSKLRNIFVKGEREEYYRIDQLGVWQEQQREEVVSPIHRASFSPDLWTHTIEN